MGRLRYTPSITELPHGQLESWIPLFWQSKAFSSMCAALNWTIMAGPLSLSDLLAEGSQYLRRNSQEESPFISDSHQCSISTGVLATGTLPDHENGWEPGSLSSQNGVPFFFSM